MLQECSLFPLFCQKTKNQKNNSTHITNWGIVVHPFISLFLCNFTPKFKKRNYGKRT